MGTIWTGRLGCGRRAGATCGSGVLERGWVMVWDRFCLCWMKNIQMQKMVATNMALAIVMLSVRCMPVSAAL